MNELIHFKNIMYVSVTKETIPKTEEKYICYDFENLIFLDTVSLVTETHTVKKYKPVCAHNRTSSEVT